VPHNVEPGDRFLFRCREVFIVERPPEADHDGPVNTGNEN
jgi:hypothetical protein